jgi:hypothetical protein
MAMQSPGQADVVFRNPALAFLTGDDEHHRLAFADPCVTRGWLEAFGG